jgi:hypothetical protein
MSRPRCPTSNDTSQCCERVKRRAARNRDTHSALKQLVGIEWNAHCSNIPFIGKRPAEALWGHRTRRRWLVEALVELHQVTLFASGDSSTKAELVPVCPRSFRLGKPRPDPMAAQTALTRSGGAKSRPIRRHPRSHRLASPADCTPRRNPVPNDVTWSARSEPVLASTRMLLRHQSNPGREVSP